MQSALQARRIRLHGRHITTQGSERIQAPQQRTNERGYTERATWNKRVRG